VHDRTFFFVSYEGFREVRASTAIATVPNELAHQGLLPSASDPGACSSATPNRCIPIGVDPHAQPFLALLPPSNGADNRDGTGDLITADKGTRMSNMAWPAWITIFLTHIPFLGVTSSTTVRPWSPISALRLGRMSLAFQ
jgi:hypothetical protein